MKACIRWLLVITHTSTYIHGISWYRFSPADGLLDGKHVKMRQSDLLLQLNLEEEDHMTIERFHPTSAGNIVFSDLHIQDRTLSLDD